MMRIVDALVVAAAVLAAVSASAQEKPGNVALVYSVKPKPGAWAQLDAAISKHYAWQRAQKAATLLDTIRKGTRSTRSYLLRYRPDLSYVPAR